MSYFNPSNAFDAEGLTRLTEKIEGRKKKRNDIEQDTKIQIREKNLETEKLNLMLEREENYARLDQQQDVENRKSEQTAEIARQRAERSQEAESGGNHSQTEGGNSQDYFRTIHRRRTFGS